MCFFMPSFHKLNRSKIPKLRTPNGMTWGSHWASAFCFLKEKKNATEKELQWQSQLNTNMIIPLKCAVYMQFLSRLWWHAQLNRSGVQKITTLYKIAETNHNTEFVHKLLKFSVSFQLHSLYGFYLFYLDYLVILENIKGSRNVSSKGLRNGIIS